MFMMAIKILTLSSVIIFSNSLAWSQSSELECYKYENQDNKLPEINEISVGLTKTTDEAAILIVKDKKNELFAANMDCPLFPNLGICGLEDDGGELEIIKIHSNESKILLKIDGLINPEIVQPEGYQYLNIKLKDSLKPRYIILKKVPKQKCHFEY